MLLLASVARAFCRLLFDILRRERIESFGSPVPGLTFALKGLGGFSKSKIQFKFKSNFDEDLMLTDHRTFSKFKKFAQKRR
jgi:hypothetical protein